MENTYYYSHLARHLSHFCHLMQGFDRTTPTPLLFAKCRNHFFLDIRLADKNKEHEETSEEVEAVDDPEEDLEVGGVVAEAPGVVGVEDVVDGGENPEEAEDEEELGVENLRRHIQIVS